MLGPFYQRESSPNTQKMKRGDCRPALVRTMPNDSIVAIVDSKQRLGGTDYDFSASFQKPISKPLSVQITRVSIPKLPNINAVDNSFTVVHELGTYTFVINPGYYNQVSLVTALTTGFNTAIAGDLFTINFNTLNKTLSIGSSNGYKWFFSSDCSFIVYGSNVANFNAFAASSNPAVVGSIIQYSGPAGLFYSRYVAVRSNALIKYAIEVPRSSSGISNNIAVLSMVNAFKESDFSVNNVYQGSIILESTQEVSCVLNTAQSGNSMTVVDFLLVDEYGFNLLRSLDLGAPFKTPQLGCLIWMNVAV